MRGVAIKMLGLAPKGYGGPLTLTQVTEGVFDPSTGGITDPVVTTYNCSGLRMNYESWDYRNTAIASGDYQIYLSPVLIDGTECPKPVTGNTITLGTEVGGVVSIEPFNSDVVNCGWKLQMRLG